MKMHGFTIAFVFSESVCDASDAVSWFNRTKLHCDGIKSSKSQERKKKLEASIHIINNSCHSKFSRKIVNVRKRINQHHELNELHWFTFTGTTLDTHAISFQELPAHQFG